MACADCVCPVSYTHLDVYKRQEKKMYLMAVDERDWPPVDCAEYYLFQLERVACSKWRHHSLSLIHIQMCIRDSNLFEKAATAKGITGEVLLQLLEGRLDNVVFRLGTVSYTHLDVYKRQS